MRSLLFAVCALMALLIGTASAAPWGTHQQWASYFDGPNHSDDRARVVNWPFVSGLSTDPAHPGNAIATTIRYDQHGHPQWMSDVHLGAHARIAGIAGANSGQVVVVAMSAGSAFVTVAYDPDTGHLLWKRVYVGPRGRFAAVHDIISAGGAEGTEIAVAGTSDGDYVTVGYSASTGEQTYADREAGGTAYALARFQGDSDLIAVTGVRDDPTRPTTFEYVDVNGDGGPVSKIPSWDIAVQGNAEVTTDIALSGTNASGPALIEDGTLLWQRDLLRGFSTVEFSSFGERVYLGDHPNVDPAPDRIVALKAATGKTRSVFTLPRDMHLVDWSLSPDSDAIAYVLGDVPGSSGQGDEDFLTMKIHPLSGVVNWRARFGRYGRTDIPASLSFAHDNLLRMTGVVVTGASDIHRRHGLDYATVSYTP